MRNLHLALLAAAIVTGTALTQIPTAAAQAGTVKAIQPGLLEVAGPRVTEVMDAGITTITATPGKGLRSIHVSSPWADSYFGWPKNVKQLAFTIDIGRPQGTAKISAPGFNEATKADYKAAIESIIPFAISNTKMAKDYAVQ